ncbi:MAG: hypothetical protein AAB413_03340, partial [Patescibacteria group bacterium]
IIEESLKNPILGSVQVIGTEIEEVTKGFGTPWLKQWTLRTVAIEETKASDFAESLSHAIETEHSSWFADFNNDTTHYIVFPDRVFVVDRSKPEQYEVVRQYGLSHGLPRHQLNFPTL